MPRTARISGALRSHATALALAGAAAAAVMSVAGTAGAATARPDARPATAPGAENFSLGTSAGTLTGTGAGATLTGAVPVQAAPAHAAPAHAAPAARASAPHAIPARRPVQLAGSTRHPAAASQHADARPEHAAVRQASPARPYEIYDSVTPASIPAHQQVAVYATGNYAASPAAVAHDGHVLWIDTQGSDPKASALDVEPGDATPAAAATWARAKLTAEPNSPAIIYTMRSEWGAAKAAIASLPARMRAEVRWWIADPTGSPHIVPGASATQWYWGQNYDISSASPGF